MSEREEKQIVTVSADVEQNADEAADFWTRF
jgi:hypothetical protein